MKKLLVILITLGALLPLPMVQAQAEEILQPGTLPSCKPAHWAEFIGIYSELTAEGYDLVRRLEADDVFSLMRDIEDGWVADVALWRFLPFCQEIVELGMQMTMARLHHLSFWALTYMEAARGGSANSPNVVEQGELMYARLDQVTRILERADNQISQSER